MSNNVVTIGDFNFERKRREFLNENAKCQHKNIQLDSQGDIALCLDCKIQVSAFWVCQRIIEQFDTAQNKIKAGRKALDEAKAKDISLLAAKRVERAWRSRTMLPTCPHCHRGISPNDGFGGSSTNKEFEKRRRLVEVKK